MATPKKTEKLPKGALRLVQTGSECFAFAKKEGENTRLNMVGYSGGVIKDHWYWGNLMINLDGMSFPITKYPILEDHRDDKKIAFTGKPLIDDYKLKVDPENDALYFRLDESAIVDSEEVRPGLILDYDANDNVIGIEMLNLSKRVPFERLKTLQFETA